MVLLDGAGYDIPKQTPPCLILYVASRRDSRMQSEALAKKLRGAGGEAEAVSAEGKTHMTINRELGRPDDPPTEALLALLAKYSDRKRR